MSAEQDARSAAVLFGIHPKKLLATVVCFTLTMVLWPLGGAQAVLGSKASPSSSVVHEPSPSRKHSHRHENWKTSSEQKSQVERSFLKAPVAETSQVESRILEVLAEQPSQVERRSKIGFSISVHPPKFSFLARFIEQWYTCEPARRASDIYAVFWGESDAALFKKGMRHLHPHVPEDAWTAVICDVSESARRESGVQNQNIAAWKKWYGIAYMMDLDDPPKYGAMVDSELLLYNTSDCGVDSAWNRLYDRVSALEESKLWTAAKVNNDANYTFPGDIVLTGRSYDKWILEDNAKFIGAHETQKTCNKSNSPGCREVKRHIDDVLFSWWTDLPYVNLRVAQQMLRSVEKWQLESKNEEELRRWRKLGRWQKHVHFIAFERFEHIAYQMWCCLHEGYHMDDVTAVAGPAIWGSFLEDPQVKNGFVPRIADLHPLWLPSDANLRIYEGKLPPMSRIDPPLLHVHVDHHPALYMHVKESHDAWKDFCLREQQAASTVMASAPLAQCDFYGW